MKRTSPHPAKRSTGSRPSSAARPRAHDDAVPETMDAEHRRLVMLGLDAVQNGDIASEDEIEAVLARSRL